MSETAPATDNGHTWNLGPLETKVMEALWSHGALGVRQVIDQLGEPLAYTTIATVLGNLQRKELVQPERTGRSVQYRPRISRGEHGARLLQQALLGTQDREASILHFVESMADEDAQLLRDYLDQRPRGGP